ncbi:hypothetical protein [Ramlibacter sp. AN1133]|uniref:hypothetical protein n=1 Tax=Ramlibacter sp. AN1133 TaxID=3133429 RepID=UPI0030BE3EB6
MKTIAIVRSTGSAQGDMILRGVYGRHTPGANAEVVGRFQIAPEFKNISYLFELLDSGETDIRPDSVHTIEVEDHLETLAKAQLMRAMAVRWEKMYANATPSQIGMQATMLKSEGAKVATAVKRHLAGLGMRAYLVPVLCEMSTYEPGRFIDSERTLMATLTNPVNVTAVADAQPMALGDALSRPAPADPEGTAAPAAGEIPLAAAPAGGEGGAMVVAAAPAPAWATDDYANGVTAQVAGNVLVLATSPEEARQAVMLNANMGQQRELTGVSLDLQPVGVIGVRPRPADAEQESGGDFDDSGFDPDFEDGDTLRDRS